MPFSCGIGVLTLREEGFFRVLTSRPAESARVFYGLAFRFGNVASDISYISFHDCNIYIYVATGTLTVSADDDIVT